MTTRPFFSFYRAVCLISVCCLLLPPVAACVREGMVSVRAVTAGLLVSAAVLLLLPIVDEPGRLSFWFALGVAAVCAAGVLTRQPERCWLSLVLVLHFASLICRGKARYAQLRPLFKHFSVWYNVENHARDVYSAGLYLLVTFFPDAGVLPGWVMPVLCLAFYVILWIRIRTGRTVFLRFKQEVEIKNLIKGNLRTAPPQAGKPSEELAKMSRVYERAMNLMEQKRPFLDYDFSLEDLASAVFTNKSYLSRSINIMSGRNFKQFVNYYRIHYCLELIRQDPHLKVLNLSSMSGFRSTVTFNLAFKLNMGETPSKYMEKLRMDKRQMEKAVR